MIAPSSYLSSSSANALISDLRPTTLSAPALLHINSFLEELLVSLISASQSINPKDLRLRGVPRVFTSEQVPESTGLRALGRSAVGEAELELRSWYESHPQARSGPRAGFQPEGRGRGLALEQEKSNTVFPLQPATELLKLKCLSFSVSSGCSTFPDKRHLRLKHLLRRLPKTICLTIGEMSGVTRQTRQLLPLRYGRLRF